MRIIAVDDEKLALDALLGSIRKAAPEAEIYGFNDAAEALNFLKDQPCEVAFLDVEMPEMNGVELAKRMKMIYPNINIIFSTGYDQYRGVAFGLHASGYLTKPILPEDVRWELEDLRRPVQLPVTKRIRVQAFGNFEVFLDGLPVRFKYERTKEMLAYLVDRLLSDGLIREDLDPDLTATLGVTGHGDTGCFDLIAGDPCGFQRNEAKLTVGDLVASHGLTGEAATVYSAVLNSLGQKHY